MAQEDQVIQPVYFLDGSAAPSGGATSTGGSFSSGGGSGAANGTIDPSVYSSPTQVGGGGSAYLEGGLVNIVELFVVYAFIIAGFLAFFFIFYGGLSFILSGGNDEKIKQAVNTIRYSIIGLVIIILSFTFVSIIGRIFDLQLVPYLSIDKIWGAINNLLPKG